MRHAVCTSSFTRYTVVFACSTGLCWTGSSAGTSVYCPVIGTFWGFRRPRPRDGLPVERVSNEDHCHDEHDDGDDDHNALKIESTQK